ncbi:hypothetical protein BN159_1666 [Streptomyces davaonensis JCM 4913]|uniref:N-acetyltransferase domain-containing protein n=1 Tax=Streptomyces davaonensis (strain DSM 101723 / JCM 4913 / KCC S-0913 / 768) TaxID=1214101 RepID=K4QYX7_STRDJ|nr:XF1762 family protein [Streptomyces davaonensis]CCK26045.1 hypothetical protein BN159_1666 [Streptomyces davaonensis JCM 4913]
MNLVIVPVSRRQADAFIDQHHRHHRPPQGMTFALGVAADGRLVGVVVAGRPVARYLDDGMTLEITRTCTDGTQNANSKLYGAACRAACALGYRRVVTYTEESESGASLRAAGFEPVARLPENAGWDRPSRRRSEQHRTVARTRWERCRPSVPRPLSRPTSSAISLPSDGQKRRVDNPRAGDKIPAPAPASAALTSSYANPGMDLSR